GALALPQHIGRVRARAFEPNPKVGHEPDRHLVLTTARDCLVVAVPRVFPLRTGPPVIEDRLAVEAQLHAADHAASGPQQDVLRLVVGQRATVRARAALAVVPGPDAHGVADDEPARARPPGGLLDQRSWKVAAPGGHLHPARPEPEAARGPVEHRGKDAGAVGPG